MLNVSDFTRIFIATIGLLICSFTPIIAQTQTESPEIPFLEDWKGSAHAEGWKDSFIERYTGPKVTTQGAIPKECARCHSTAGLHDYLGLDGSPAGETNADAIPKNGIACVACHNKATLELESVTFPSGETVEMYTRDVRCMMCHQGRNSTVSINEALSSTSGAPDTVANNLLYIDSHFLPAATRFGTEAKGGYEYEGLEYEGFYIHDEEASRCFDCHALHTEKISPETCSECHRKVSEEKDFKDVRKTKTDFDGDGNIKEGIAFEMRSLQRELYNGLLTYAKDVAGTPMAYSQKIYPYFFIDTNANGKVDEGEAVAANKYQSWTPRMIRAAYNFQYIVNEPGAFVHNPFYSLQLLFDSLNDLSGKVAINMDAFTRP